MDFVVTRVLVHIAVIVNFSDSYTLLPNKYCANLNCKKITIDEAKTTCSADPTCSMFYDYKNKGTRFCFCKENDEIKESSYGAFLYVKRKPGNKYLSHYQTNV